MSIYMDHDAPIYPVKPPNWVDEIEDSGYILKYKDDWVMDPDDPEAVMKFGDLDSALYWMGDEADQYAIHEYRIQTVMEYSEALTLQLNDDGKTEV